MKADIIIYGNMSDWHRSLIRETFPNHKILSLNFDYKKMWFSLSILIRFIAYYLMSYRIASSYVSAVISVVNPTLVVTNQIVDIRFHEAARGRKKNTFLALCTTLTQIGPIAVLPNGDFQSELGVFGPVEKRRVLSSNVSTFRKTHITGNPMGFLDFEPTLSTANAKDSSILLASTYTPGVDNLLHVETPILLPQLLHDLNAATFGMGHNWRKSEQHLYKNRAACTAFALQELYILHIIQLLARGASTNRILVALRHDTVEEVQHFKRYLPMAELIQRSSLKRARQLSGLNGVFVSSSSNMIVNALSANKKAVWISIGKGLQMNIPPSKLNIVSSKPRFIQECLTKILNLSNAEFHRAAREEIQGLLGDSAWHKVADLHRRALNCNLDERRPPDGGPGRT